MTYWTCLHSKLFFGWMNTQIILGCCKLKVCPWYTCTSQIRSNNMYKPLLNMSGMKTSKTLKSLNTKRGTNLASSHNITCLKPRYNIGLFSERACSMNHVCKYLAKDNPKFQIKASINDYFWKDRQSSNHISLDKCVDEQDSISTYFMPWCHNIWTQSLCYTYSYRWQES